MPEFQALISGAPGKGACTEFLVTTGIIVFTSSPCRPRRQTSPGSTHVPCLPHALSLTTSRASQDRGDHGSPTTSATTTAAAAATASTLTVCGQPTEGTFDPQRRDQPQERRHRLSCQLVRPLVGRWGAATFAPKPNRVVCDARWLPAPATGSSRRTGGRQWVRTLIVSCPYASRGHRARSCHGALGATTGHAGT